MACISPSGKFGIPTKAFLEGRGEASLDGRALNLGVRLDVNLNEQALLAEGLMSTFAVRYLSMNNAEQIERDEYVKRNFPQNLKYVFRDEDTHIISKAKIDYNLLLIGGSDASRIARFIKINQPIFKNCTMIALLDNADPARRSQLLHAGFDDVINWRRMPDLELSFRLRAIHTRRHQALKEESRNQSYGKVFPITQSKTITSREKKILNLLTARIGSVVTYNAILIEISNYDYEVSLESLKVSISNLRKKLGPEWVIKATELVGYTLIRQKVNF